MIIDRPLVREFSRGKEVTGSIPEPLEQCALVFRIATVVWVQSCRKRRKKKKELTTLSWKSSKYLGASALNQIALSKSEHLFSANFFCFKCNGVPFAGPKTELSANKRHLAIIDSQWAEFFSLLGPGPAEFLREELVGMSWCGLHNSSNAEGESIAEKRWPPPVTFTKLENVSVPKSSFTS